MISYKALLAILPMTGAIMVLAWMAARIGLLSDSQDAACLPILTDLRPGSGDGAERGPALRGRIPAARIALMVVLVFGLIVPLITAIWSLHAPTTAPAAMQAPGEMEPQ